MRVSGVLEDIVEEQQKRGHQPNIHPYIRKNTDLLRASEVPGLWHLLVLHQDVGDSLTNRLISYKVGKGYEGTAALMSVDQLDQLLVEWSRALTQD